MLAYPSISKQVQNIDIHAFDKLDGSNIRVEWSRKSGFYKYGTRTRLLDPNEEPLGEAKPIFEGTMAEALEPALRRLRAERAVLFLEFHGEHSFAGSHGQEPHRLTLFDVSLHRQGFMLPREFRSTFGDLVDTPNLLYLGKPNGHFLESVRSGELDGMTFEGVVCKSQELVRNRQVVFKVKNRAWLERLRDRCGGDEGLFNRLA